jgi:hypothetical protein
LCLIKNSLHKMSSKIKLMVENLKSLRIDKYELIV